MKTNLLFTFLSLFIFFGCDSESSGDVSSSSSASSPSIAKDYKVTFNVNGGSTIASLSIKEGEKITKPQDPTRAGYTFGNWYQDQALTTVFDFNTIINADTTLYASWSAIAKNYQVTFNVNGGSAVASASVKQGSKVTKPQNPTRTGYTFDNWYQDQALTTVFDFNTIIDKDTTLYASWYIALKQRDSSKDFTFSVANDTPYGALYHQDHFYIVDHSRGYIYAFDKSGNAVTSKDLKNFVPSNWDLNGLTYHNGVFYSYGGSGKGIVAINEDGSLNGSETFSPAKEGAPAYYDGAIYTIRSDGIFAYDINTKNADTSKNITYSPPDNSSYVEGAYLVYKHYLYLVYNKSSSPFKVVCVNLKEKKVETSRGFDIARNEWTGLNDAQGLMFYDGNFYLVSSDFSGNNKVFVFGAGKL